MFGFRHVSCSGWSAQLVEDIHMAWSGWVVEFLGGKKDENRQRQGIEVSFVWPMWKEGSVYVI